MLIKIYREDIPNTSDTPIFDYCRKLIAEGVDSDTRLEVYRNNPEFDIAIDKIGIGAELSVNNNIFIEYRKSHARIDLKHA